MKALVLSGGKGTRLRPLSFSRAKQLVPVMNKPVLGHVLDNLSTVSDEIILLSSPERINEIKEYVSQNEWNINIDYIVQETPAGLAHAVKTAEGKLKNEKFIVWLGDNLINEDIREYVKEFKSSNCDALIFLKEVENPKAFGIAVLNENKEVIKLIEKPLHPPTNYAIVGIYLFSPSIFEAIRHIKPSKRGEYEITDAITWLIENGYKVKAKMLNGWWMDTGKKDDVLQVNKLMLEEKLTVEMIKGKVGNTIIKGNVVIEEEAKIINSKIIGPCIIGKSVKISNSVVGPYVSIGDETEIENSRIENSIILPNTYIKNIHLVNSLIGEKSRIVSESKTKISAHVGDYGEINLWEGVE